jgi:hypothetical protein
MRNSKVRSFISGLPGYLKRENFIPAQSGIFGVFLVLLWLIQYWNIPGNPNLIGRISFQVADKPWVPSGQIAEPILGLHYFGDWMLSVAWALNENCYQLEEFSCQQPPFGLWILRIWNFAFIDMKFGYLTWIVTASAIYIFLIKRMLKSHSSISKYLFFLVFVLSSPGNLISIDRGSLHFMTFALLGLSYYLYKKGCHSWALIFLIFSISLKPQMLLATLILILYRRYKHFFIAIFATAMINLLLIFTFPGDPGRNLIGYVKASLGYVNSEASFGNIMNSVSIIGIISRYIEASTGWGTSLSYLTQYADYLIIPGIVWLGLVILLLTRQKVSAFTSYTLVLSLTSLIIPASSPYTMGWATLAMLIFLQEPTKDKKEFVLRKSQNAQLFTLMIITITPGFILYSGISGFSRHIPLIIFLPIVLAWIYGSEFFYLRSKKVGQKTQEK